MYETFIHDILYCDLKYMISICVVLVNQKLNQSGLGVVICVLEDAYKVFDFVREDSLGEVVYECVQYRAIFLNYCMITN